MHGLWACTLSTLERVDRQVGVREQAGKIAPSPPTPLQAERG
jgi:hypothetical protein